MKSAAWRARGCVGWACRVSSSPRGQVLVSRDQSPCFSFPLGGGGGGFCPSPWVRRLCPGPQRRGRPGGGGKGKDVLRSDEAEKRRSKDGEEWTRGVETTEELQAFVALSFFFFLMLEKRREAKPTKKSNQSCLVGKQIGSYSPVSCEVFSNDSSHRRMYRKNKGGEKHTKGRDLTKTTLHTVSSCGLDALLCLVLLVEIGVVGEAFAGQQRNRHQVT